jgi:ABC-type multidrug transport system fused ATPase/permease subunit
MIKTYRKILALLSPREKRQFLLLFLMVLGVGLLEVVGVASILPFLAVTSDPSVIERNAILSRVYALSGVGSPQDFLVVLGAGVFCVVVFGLIFKALTFHMLFRFTSMRIYSISTRLMHGYLAQPYVWFLSRNSADLGKNMLSEVDRVVHHVLIQAMRFMAQSVVIACLVILLVIAKPEVAFGAAIVLGGAYSLVYLLARRRVKFRGADQLAANAARFKIVNEAFGGIKDVKTLGLEKVYLERFRGPARRVSQAEYYVLTLSEVPRHLLEAVAFGGMLLLVLWLLVSSDNGSISEILPLLGLYAFAGVRLFPASQQMYSAFTKLRFGGAMLDNLHADLAAVSAAARAPLPPVAKPLGLTRALELRGVRFSYPETDRAALNGLDMTIAANTTVGVVGGSGAGKTTAVDVILGLLEPQEGVVLVDGVAVDASNRRSWRRSVGYVPQQIFLTDDTIAANIAFGVPADQIDMGAVERAARIAELHDFVLTELPGGYDTIVGERGVRLSGGQRQRIGIARALYHDPDVLVLDEATSALDNLTEKAVMDAVANLGHAKTIVLVAHRLSTVRGCDTIFRMERGVVAAQGSYNALYAEDAGFRRLASLSHGGADASAETLSAGA